MTYPPEKKVQLVVTVGLARPALVIIAIAILTMPVLLLAIAVSTEDIMSEFLQTTLFMHYKNKKQKNKQNCELYICLWYTIYSLSRLFGSP